MTLFIHRIDISAYRQVIFFVHISSTNFIKLEKSSVEIGSDPNKSRSRKNPKQQLTKIGFQISGYG